LADSGIDTSSDKATFHDLLNKPLRAQFEQVAPKAGSGFRFTSLSADGSHMYLSFQQRPDIETEITVSVPVRYADMILQSADLKKVTEQLNLSQIEATYHFDDGQFGPPAPSDKEDHDTSPYRQFQMNDKDGINLSPYIKWGDKTWVGLSRETQSVGLKPLTSNAAQSRFIKEGVVTKEKTNGFELSGEAFIKYETEIGLTIRLGVTPPIQDTIDKRVENQTKWNVHIQMPL